MKLADAIKGKTVDNAEMDRDSAILYFDDGTELYFTVDIHQYRIQADAKILTKMEDDR